eukprot:5338133-Pleurochrysis_carterae.AAC.1
MLSEPARTKRCRIRNRRGSKADCEHGGDAEDRDDGGRPAQLSQSWQLVQEEEQQRGDQARTCLAEVELVQHTLDGLAHDDEVVGQHEEEVGVVGGGGERDHGVRRPVERHGRADEVAARRVDRRVDG